MYIVSVNAQDYFIDAQLTTISTTKNENEAPKFDNAQSHIHLKTLRRLGYEPLLIRVPHSIFI
jgi:hypothetical protein